MLSARYAPIAVIALLVAGLLAFGPAGNVEADVESHSVDPASVVASGGSVTATLQANANGQDVFIIVTDPVLTTFLDEECLVDASPCTVGGADCDDALLTLLGPGIYCRQYSADQDGVAGADAFSVTLAVTVTCQSTAAFGVEAGNWDDQDFTLPEFASVALECILPGTPGTFLITKAFDGDPTQTFEFTYATGISATCTLAGSPDQALSDGDTFSLAGGESALLFDCGQGDHTVTETPPDPAIASLTAIDCGEDPDVTVDLASASATVRTADSVGNIIGGGTCTFTNTAVVTDTPDIIVMKECVGEFTATFEVTVGERPARWSAEPRKSSRTWSPTPTP